MQKSILLIPAVEVHASHGEKVAHVTILGCEDLKFRKYIDVLELIDNAHSAGGIAINVHPFGGFFRPGFTEENIVKRFDAVEVLNGMTPNRFNRKALRMAEMFEMKKTAGSDAHTLRMVGDFACEIDADSVDGIIRAVKKGKVKIPEKKTEPINILTTQVARKIYTKLGLNK